MLGLLLLYWVSAAAQNSHIVTLTLNQPALLGANAGNNVVANSGAVVNIGGVPAATGGTSPYSYSWSPVDGISNPTESNPTLTVDSTTSYTLNVTDAKGCTTSSGFTVSIVTALNGLEQNLLKTYPNPSSQYLIVETELIGAQLIISDALGRKVRHITINQKTNSIDVVGLSAGTYNMQVSKGAKMQSVKIIIE